MSAWTTERTGLALGVLMLGAGLALVLVVGRRVRELEMRELDVGSRSLLAEGAGAPGELRLVSADLELGDEVTFELCSKSTLEPSSYAPLLGTAIVRLADGGDEEVVRGPLELGVLEGARRSRAGACLDVGRGTIELAGTYVTIVTWSAPLPESLVSFRGRTLARRSLEVGDRNMVFGILVCVLLAALAFYARPLASPSATRALPIAVAISGASALALWLVMGVLTPLLPRGSMWGLFSGLLLAGVEVALALSLAGATRLDVLGIGRAGGENGGRWERARPYVLLAASPFFALLLYRLAQIALRLVPSTGEAPIEAFVAWPSGMLAFAALAVAAPLAEEIFFRGLVYGVLAGDERHARGRRVLFAALGSWLVFALVHLPQTWGSWGGLLSIAVAAAGFTALRAASGSVVVPAVAHLVYNGLLSAQGLMSS